MASNLTPPSSTFAGVVSGSVSVSNFPAVQAVSGTVAVSSVAGTVAISAASLPLPAGAATEATLQAERDAVQDVALTAILERELLEVST